MKKLLCIISLVFCCTLLRAQPDTLMYTPEYLDTVNVNRVAGLNDYFMIGANYGVSFSTMFFNPNKMGTDIRFNPTYFSVMFTHYEKMFNYLPYFGLTMGLSYWHSGVRFNDNPDTGYPLGYIDGATDETIETVELPAMMQMHFDSAPVKVLANLGGYVGYQRNHASGFAQTPVDLLQGRDVLQTGNGHANHLRAGTRKLQALGYGCLHIGGMRVTHGLYDDGSAAANHKALAYVHINRFQSFHIRCPWLAALSALWSCPCAW